MDAEKHRLIGTRPSNDGIFLVRFKDGFTSICTKERINIISSTETKAERTAGDWRDATILHSAANEIDLNLIVIKAGMKKCDENKDVVNDEPRPSDWFKRLRKRTVPEKVPITSTTSAEKANETELNLKVIKAGMKKCDENKDVVNDEPRPSDWFKRRRKRTVLLKVPITSNTSASEDRPLSNAEIHKLLASEEGGHDENVTCREEEFLIPSTSSTEGGSEILSAYDKELEENYENLKGAKVALHSYFAKNNAAVGKMMASGDYIPPDDAEELNIIDTVCGKILGEQCMKDIADMLPSVDVKAEVVEPGCRLPQNFTGEWINTANIDADVVINETHIVETWYPDDGRYRRTLYVCREQRDSRFMMARLTVDGCQKDYVCFDFVPQHHNVIRYRKGLAVIKDNFHTVCSYVQFPNKEQWKYDLYLAKNPVPVKCPIAGKFNFTQKGDVPFETRILGGVTLSPRPNLYCKENISDFSVCDTDKKEIAIDENYCLSVDYKGRPTDIYSDPDYRMKCIGFWKENLKSYLITYDELDPFSKYRCWVYQRADLNRILMSQAIGPFCDLKQDVTSWNNTEGAAVAIDMTEYERERDQCPMFFDDGTNPWENKVKERIIFRFGFSSASTGTLSLTVVSISILTLSRFLLS